MTIFRNCLAAMKRKLRTWRQAIKEYSEKCLTSGYIPTSLGSVRFIARQLARILVFTQLGKLRVIGKENLDLPGRFIFCPNHSAFFDAPVLYAFMRKPVRYMTAYEEMRGLWGLKAIVMGAMGCFPVDRTQGKSVIKPAIDVLVSGQSLTIFPEGKISQTGECLPFKMGPAIIARAAYDQLEGKATVGIIPINIVYHKRDNETATKDFFACGLKWRGGVTVTVGKPIYLNEHPDCKPEELMALAHRFVCQAQAEATKLSCPCNK